MILITYSVSDSRPKRIEVAHAQRPTLAGLLDVTDYDKAWVAGMEERITRCTSLVIAEYTSNKHWYEHAVSVYVADDAAINHHDIDIDAAAALAAKEDGLTLIWVDGERHEVKYPE